MKYVLNSKALLWVLFFCLSGAVQAQTPFKEMPAGKYMLEKTHASLTWKISHLGLSNYTARFTDFDAQIDFKPKNIEQSQVKATVNPRSVKTDYPYVEKEDFDKKLTTDKWFNVGKFPSITFTSKKLKLTGDKTATLHGDLRFLGVSKPISLEVTMNGAMAKHPFNKKPTLGFSAIGTIKRSEWGFETYIPNIGDEVTLLIEAEFNKDK